MNKEEITKELLLNYSGSIEDKLVNDLLAMLESQLREQIALDIENAIIEVVGNSAATMQQAVRIVRGSK